MTDPIDESIETLQRSSPEIEEALAVLQFMAANAFTIVGGIFAIIFMIVVFFIFVKALRGMYLGDLFQGEVKQEMSITKFWTNVAYFCATIAFLAMNLISGVGGETLVFIWLIYLGTVGTSAVASKWLALRYSETLMRSAESNEKNPRMGRIHPDPSGFDNPDDVSQGYSGRPRGPTRTGTGSGSRAR